ncbi:hypothetical protein SNK03_006506 [Fusarium graminearum]
MDPSYNQPLSEHQMNMARQLIERNFFVDCLSLASDQELDYGISSPDYPSRPATLVSMPPTEPEVVAFIMSTKSNCTKLLDGFVKLGFEPRHAMVPLENRDSNDRQSAFVKFLEAVYEGNTLIRNRTRIVAIFKWFIECQDSVHSLSASDLHPRKTSHWTDPGRPRAPMDHLTEMLKWQTSGFRVFGIAMTPQCPASFLRVFLSNRTQEDQEFVAVGKVWKSSGADLPRGMHYAMTYMESIVTHIYRDLFGATEHVGGRLRIDQEYRAKLALLKQPQWTDNTEAQALRNLAEVVNDILHEMELQTDFSQAEEGAGFKTYSWFRLCRAVSGLANDSYRAETEEYSKYHGDRRHRFVIDPLWDPRLQWIESELDQRVLDSILLIAQLPRVEVANLWREMILERGNGCQWWEVEEAYNFHVDAWDVEKALEEGALDRFADLSL